MKVKNIILSSAIIIVIASIVYLIKLDNEKRQKLSKMIDTHHIIDNETAMPDKGLVLASGCIKTLNSPIIEGFNIENNDALALILRIEVYQKVTIRKRPKYRKFFYYDYEDTEGWYNQELNDDPDIECHGINTSGIEAKLYFGNSYVFRDSIELNQQIII